MKSILFLLAVGATVLAALFLGATFIDPFSMQPLDRDILFAIRLPRVLTAFLVGMALGASGAVLQGILRNPLADPYVIGISGGAALSATGLALLPGIYLLGSFTVPAAAFAGAAAASVLVGVFGWKGKRLLPERLLLAGVGLGFLFYALLMLLVNVSSTEGVRRALLWIFGDLSSADFELILPGVLLIGAGLSTAAYRAKALNALMLGDDLAHSLGFSVHRERLCLFVAVALMTGASVSLGGTIGFIGLIIPHVIRLFAGSDSRILIPASALAGGAFLCLSDLIGRMAMPPSEIPAGIVTALIGSPYFLYLLRKKNILGE
jgi:iron complex transport system permease protein